MCSIMKAAALQPTGAAGAAAASGELAPPIRRSSRRCVLLFMGSLLWAGIRASSRGFLRVTGVRLTGSAGTHSAAVMAARSQSPPNLSQDVLDFLARQNVTKGHHAGVRVDLSHEKSIDGRMYREVGGGCPVYGKYIVLYQPNREPYTSNFLDDVPTEEEYRRLGNPLSGGFGMTMATASNERFSPMPMERLRRASGIITATTDLGRCAQYAFQTHALSPSTNKKTDYRFPFVYDPRGQQCYLLFISMQQMLGSTYCSMYGDQDLPWYCFEPKKSPTKNAHLVYGSAYVGEDPEYHVKNCPDKALAGQRFGVWDDGVCKDYTQIKGSVVEDVENKEACWVLAFMNEKVATDQPLGYAAWAANPWTSWLPYMGSTWPQSHGVGHNYAVFSVNRHSKKQCVLSDQAPSCLITDTSAVSYTALSALEETTLDYMSPSTEHFSPCDYSRCTRVWTREESGAVAEQEEVPCSEEEQKDCRKGDNTLLFGGLAALGILLLAIAVGSVVYLRKKKATPAGEEVQGAEARGEFEGGRRRRRTQQGDLMQEAEPSFWDEADDDTGYANQTNVVVEEAG